MGQTMRAPRATLWIRVSRDVAVGEAAAGEEEGEGGVVVGVDILVVLGGLGARSSSPKGVVCCCNRGYDYIGITQ